MALYHSSLRWFEACSCKPASRGLPSSLLYFCVAHFHLQLSKLHVFRRTTNAKKKIVYRGELDVCVLAVKIRRTVSANFFPCDRFHRECADAGFSCSLGRHRLAISYAENDPQFCFVTGASPRPYVQYGPFRLPSNRAFRWYLGRAGAENP